MRPQMSMRVLAMLATAALFVAACGDDDTTATVYTPEELGTALLAPADMGSGWQEEEKQITTSTSTPESTVAEEDGYDFCSEAKVPSVDVSAGGAMVVLSSPLATEERPVGVLETLWSGEDAARLFDEIEAAFESCIGKTWDVGGDTVTAEEFPDPPTIGDESYSVVSLAGEAPSGELEWYMPSTIARFDNTIVLVRYLEIHPTDTPRQVTSEVYNDAVDKAAAKLEAFIES